jgi:hypothetical protein
MRREYGPSARGLGTGITAVTSEVSLIPPLAESNRQEIVRLYHFYAPGGSDGLAVSATGSAACRFVGFSDAHFELPGVPPLFEEAPA